MEDRPFDGVLAKLLEGADREYRKDIRRMLKAAGPADTTRLLQAVQSRTSSYQMLRNALQGPSEDAAQDMALEGMVIGRPRVQMANFNAELLARVDTMLDIFTRRTENRRGRDRDLDLDLDLDLDPAEGVDSGSTYPRPPRIEPLAPRGGGLPPVTLDAGEL
jgi:hypothetical protein